MAAPRPRTPPRRRFGVTSPATGARSPAARWRACFVCLFEARDCHKMIGANLPMPALSVVVVVYNIPREAPRTLFSLSAEYQRGIDPDEYEVIVVDNGSAPVFDRAILDDLRGTFRLIRIDDAPASPAHAVNRGIAAASGDVVGVMIDRARLVTPGL